ncbi:tetratricopeptide (TPR) repeat protein [Runella defluvii]|uniref:Tetratricopeptide (TPR) repeat protein n=1 Tax=Runella defluvii TaxID=370973 RepID=A0A7W6ER57_9BACT|nr:hypothetical protein [Runella defluvii]MBB3839310.1 tetratricopeptide (TPR) repeat protein [Runella defluvii]
MERIENYFNHTLSEAERAEFETELKANPALAQEVAFWLQARAAAQAEARARRKEELTQLGQQLQQKGRRSLYYALSAAASVVLCLGISWYVWLRKSVVESDYNQAWASTYIEKNLSTLDGLKLGNAETDSLQWGIRSYNEGDLQKAKAIFEALLQRDSTNAEAEKNAGLVSLRLKEYDQAIEHFHRLGTRTDLVSNPGKFYEAIALLMKNEPLTQKSAQNLLKEVKRHKLEGWKDVE